MNDMESYTGETIDRYAFQELIGTGTFGEVYKCFDNKLSRYVAIKATSPDLAIKSEGKEVYIREARIHARAEHVHIVPIYDVFDDDKSVFIVMRLVNGENLDQMLTRLGHPLRLDEANQIMHQILWGMDYAHSKGIVHLDLKPGNIRMTHSGEALIMDFGIATLLEEQGLINGKLHGTPAYMAPEQIECSYMDARSDIYSLGLMYYKMITGHHPFEDAGSLTMMLNCHKERVPVRPSHFISSLPEAVDDAILKSLEKKSRNRYHSCREFALALNYSLTGNTQYDTGYKELRWDPRVSVYLNARIQLSKDSEFISAETVNLSVSGVKLRVSSYIDVGSNVLLELYLPEDDHYIKISARATVLWSDGEPGMENIEIGLGLNELDKKDRYHISLFVRNHLLSGDEDELPGDQTVIFT